MTFLKKFHLLVGYKGATAADTF